ncbi:hypothetical protein AVEN_114050-1 [Araneus ventricosus]|uniref:Uncharacterized protein n=1 Tax=Araneus ventricosus TaxID=182803 RepID=A0A4Y2UDN4_ARAVE|nr:hypothetical protein AVEN_114050-1 [Araneus ventricosus]
MRAKANHDSVDAIQSSGIAYRKARAEYKKLLLTTKRKAWESYCLNYNERFGTLFNIVFNKLNSGHSIAVNPNKDPNLTVQDRISYIMEDFFPGRSPGESLNYTPTIGPVEPLIIEDLEIVFGNLKGRGVKHPDWTGLITKRQDLLPIERWEGSWPEFFVPAGLPVTNLWQNCRKALFNPIK